MVTVSPENDSIVDKIKLVLVKRIESPYTVCAESHCFTPSGVFLQQWISSDNYVLFVLDVLLVQHQRKEW